MRDRSSRARGVPVGAELLVDANSQGNSRGRDPTGTFDVRKALSRELGAGWRMVRLATSKVVGENDSFGFRGGFRDQGVVSFGVSSLQMMASSASQLEVFNTWMGNLQDRTFEGLHPALQKAVRKGYRLGAAQARARLEKRTGQASRGAPLPGPGLIEVSAIQDLAGITAAVRAQGSRYVADSVSGKTHPSQVARGLGVIVDKVGVGRSNLLVNHVVIRAHAAGTLDALEAAGVRVVGVVPERVAHAHTHIQDSLQDYSVEDAPVELAGIKFKVPQPRQPTTKKPTKKSNRTSRARRPAPEVPEGLLGFMTQGDDRVCEKCLAVAAAGPYSIDQARGLIPQHPRCRCYFVQYEGSDES